MWDLGAISGKLGLDTEGFTGGILNAEALSRLFGPILAEAIENPALAAGEALKEIGEAAVEGLTKLLDISKEVAAHDLGVGLEALKAGLPVEEFSKLSAVAATVNVSMEQLGLGFKFIQQNASEAVETGGKAMQGFTDLGISAQFLKDNLNDSGAIFTAVQKSLDGISDSADRVRIAREILGRQGTNLLPLFEIPDDQKKALEDFAGKIGAVIDPKDVENAKAFKTVEEEISLAWDSIEHKLTGPILDYVAKHATEIGDEIIKITNKIGDAIDKAWAYVESPAGQKQIDKIKDGFQEILADMPSLTQFALAFAESMLAAAKAMEEIYNLSGLAAVNKTADFVQGLIYGPDPGSEEEAQRRVPFTDQALGESIRAGNDIKITINQKGSSPTETIDAIKKELVPQLQKAQENQKQAVKTAAHKLKISNATGSSF
jgi:hypothetical protein